MDANKSRARRTEDVVGLDVSNGVISAARLAASSKVPLRLLNAGWATVSPGASERELAIAIRDVWRSASMPSRTVCASLRSRSAILPLFFLSRHGPGGAGARAGPGGGRQPAVAAPQIALDWHLNHQRNPGRARPSVTRGCWWRCPARRWITRWTSCAEAGPVSGGHGPGGHRGGQFCSKPPIRIRKSQEDTCGAAPDQSRARTWCPAVRRRQPVCPHPACPRG